MSLGAREWRVFPSLRPVLDASESGAGGRGQGNCLVSRPGHVEVRESAMHVSVDDRLGPGPLPPAPCPAVLTPDAPNSEPTLQTRGAA